MRALAFLAQQVLSSGVNGIPTINLSTSSLEPEGATIQYLRHMDKQLFMMEKEPDIGSLDQPIYQIFLKQHVTSQSTNTSSLRCGK